MKKLLTIQKLLIIVSVLFTFSAYAETEPNDDANSANTLVLNGSDSGILSATDFNDWWKIIIPSDGKLVVNTTSDATLDIDLYLYDINGTTLIANYDTSTGIHEATHYNHLMPGTYYVNAYRYAGYGSYTISSIYIATGLTNDAENNDSFQVAVTLPLNGSSTGHLYFYSNGYTDMNDWWKIIIPADGKLVINTTSDATLDIDLFLYDINGTTLIANYDTSTGIHEATHYNHLMPGTYYVNAYRYAGYGSYTISSIYIATGLTNDTENNDSFQLAVTLPLNGSSTGHLYFYSNGYTDMNDWWKIIIPADGKLVVNTTSDATLDIDLFLYDINGTTWIANYDTSTGIHEATHFNNLMSGTYYVNALRYSGYGSYTISSIYIATGLTNDTGNNDISSQAQNLPVNDSLTGHLGYYGNGTTDMNDWWKITTTMEGRLIINTLSNFSLCVVSYLYAQDTTTELTNTHPGSCSDTNRTMTSGKLFPGTYFVKSNRYSGYGSYQIKNIFEPSPIAKFGYVGHINNFSFNDSSLYATSYFWDFADGSTGTTVNPSHTFQQPGVYNICLIATNPAGSDTFCLPVNVKGIRNVYINHAGNTGNATVYVYGGGFTSNTTFKLVRSGYPDIVGDTVIIPFIGAIRTTFDLTGQQTGQWDVVVEIPGDTIMTVVNSFTIEPGIPADPWVDVVGRDKILFNRWQTYDIFYGNNANVDASGVPLWIVVSNEPGIIVEFSGFQLELPKVATDSGWTAIRDSVPIYFDTLFMGFNARIYPFYVPIIPAGQTEIVKMRVKTNQSIKVMAWVNPPYFQSPMSQDVKDCIIWAQAKAVANGLINLAPGAGCVNSVVTNYVYDPWSSYPPLEPAKPKSWGSILWTMATTALSCVTSVIPMSAVAELAVSVVSIGADFYDNCSAVEECKKGYEKKSQKNKSINAVSSFDPNEIVGPAGYTTANYTLKNDAYSYTIYFENKDSATAPAQEVIVIDTLDMTSFDITDFSFGPITFGDTVIYPLSGLNEFTADVDLRPDKDIIVRINAQLDTITGIVRWYYVSLDTATMDLPEDPMGGFLPPNVIPPEGEGSVSYTVGLKQSLTHDSQFKNKATIVFDLNPPILTNEWLNTLDTIKPVSQVEPLSAVINDTIFEVQWTGTDAGCGLMYYTVYVSENDSVYEPWKSYTSDISAFFTGEFGKTYKFFSIACDSVGNIEDSATSPDAETQLLVSVIENTPGANSLAIIPNPANNQVTIEFETTQPEIVTITINDILGREKTLLVNENKTAGKHRIIVITTDFESGVYFLNLKTETSSITEKMLIVR